MTHASASLLALVPLVAAACATDELTSSTDDVSDGPVLERHDSRGVLVQPGSHLLLLGVTSDNHAIYQDGQIVYATALRPGAQRQRIGEVPTGNQAFIYIARKVAFVWTDPDFSLPGFGVSPLVIWTAAHGAVAASPASPIGTLVTAASDDGRFVIFPDHTDAAGSITDLIYAPADLSRRTTLVAEAAASFPNGPCRPMAAFLGSGARAYPAAAYCTGGATRATLSTWRDGGREDVDNLVTPPRIFVDPPRGLIATTRLDATNTAVPVVVAPRGLVTTVDHVPSSRVFFGGDGATLYTDLSAAPSVGLRRDTTRRPPTVVTDRLASIAGFGFGSEALNTTPTSADGSALLLASAADPATGLTDLVVANLHAGTRTTVDASLLNTTVPGIPPFSSDSRYLITNTITDTTTFEGPLVATRLCDQQRFTISDDRPWAFFSARGSNVLVADNLSTDPSNFTLDLRFVDLDTGRARPVATGITINFFLSPDRETAVYTTAGDGLFAARR